MPSIEVFAIAALGDPALDIQLETVELFSGDEIDETGDGIGAIYGGSAAGDHFYVSDDGGRNRVDVDIAACVGDGNPAPVAQNEIPVRAETRRFKVAIEPWPEGSDWAPLDDDAVALN